MLTVTGFSIGFAGGHGYGSLIENPADLQQRVTNMIQIPVPAQGELAGEVYLVFRVDQNGRLDVLSATGDHLEVISQVKEDLSHTKVNADNSLKGKTYKMNFKYSSQASGSSPQAI